MIGLRLLLALAILSVLGSGCSVYKMDQYDSFESWYTGHPQKDYDTFGAEDTPQIARMLYGPFLGIPYFLRDVARHITVIGALPYYGVEKQIKAPAPSAQPAPTGLPEVVEQIAAEHWSGR